MKLIEWKDALGNKWSSVIFDNDGTKERIINSGGSILSEKEVKS